MFKRKHYGLPGILAVDFVQLRKRSVPFGKAELFPRLFLSHVGPQRFFFAKWQPFLVDYARSQSQPMSYGRTGFGG